nr:hypothetical protein Itr_chr08CG19180 [Ipomoea trifida]
MKIGERDINIYEYIKNWGPCAPALPMSDRKLSTTSRCKPPGHFFNYCLLSVWISIPSTIVPNRT